MSTRFWRWMRAEVWDRLRTAVARRVDTAEQIDWAVRFGDHTMVRAH